MNKGFILALAQILLAGSLGACSGTLEPTAESVAQDKALTKEVKALKRTQEQFAKEGDALIAEIQTFRGQPGWSELAPILKVRRGTASQADALKGWGEKWKQSPETVDQQYRQLVERSAAMEKRRKEIGQAWNDMKDKEREVVQNSGIVKPRDLDTAIANSQLKYEMNRVNLNRYGLDEFGLFTRVREG